MTTPHAPGHTEEVRGGRVGTAVMLRLVEGRVVVDHADDLIRVSCEVPALLGLGPDDVLVLDTAGQYRYRRVDHPADPSPPPWVLYRRITEEEPPCTPTSTTP